ncbi:MAG: hypothetical protein FJX72_04095, partial [Armatimonadetes bacterium]|nr:hypothetical protein [Armatimonadota bacterium]
ARPDSMTAALVILCLNNVMGGVFWAGVGLLQFNVVIEATPADRRSVYVGALSAVTGIAGGIAPILGGVVVEALRSHPLTVMGVALNSYHVLFALNSLTRLFALPLVRVLPASGGTTASDVLGRLGAVRVGSLIQMHRLQRGHTERERRQAVSALSAARLALAVQELTPALTDPSHRVRREAARALGEIGDEAAVEPLVARLADASSGIVTECAEALGRIGSSRAAGALARLLNSPAGEERLAAARALERLGDPACVADLLAALDRALAASAWDEVTAVIEALGACGDAPVAERLAGLLDHEQRGVRVAAFSALGEIGDGAVGERVELAFRREPDPVVRAHAAFALATTGRVSAVAAMYRSMADMESAIARKQVAYAIGALLDDTQMYRLLAGPSFDQEEAVVKLIRGAGARRSSARTFGSQRRSRLIEQAAEAYAEGDVARAATVLLRTASPDSGPVGELVAEARRSVADRAPSPEEFLVILAAVRFLAEQERKAV